SSQVFRRDAINFETLRHFDLVIWDEADGADGAESGMTPGEVDIFVKLYQADVPLYFIGQDLARAGNNLSGSARVNWSNLIHLRATTEQAGDGGIEIVELAHRVGNGPFGTVGNFKLAGEYRAVPLDTGEIVLARSGDAAVLLA